MVLLRLAPLTQEGDIRRVAALEAASYPADEAASDSGIRFRQKNAGDFFWAAYLPNDQESETLVGFVNGTLTTKGELTDESMSEHEPNGTLLCIHSVVIDPAFRRRGLAVEMLKRYVDMVRESQLQVKSIMLIAKAYLVGFYVNCGFSVTRLSPVVHGQDPWFELALDCELARQPPLIQVDAFSSAAFQGNPAAVVLLSSAAYHKSAVSDWMQRVAMENNLSETAYTAPRERSVTTPANVVPYDLRWFTPGKDTLLLLLVFALELTLPSCAPAAEVELCGHATLSTAFALHDAGKVATDQILHFHTLSGVLVCRFEEQPDTHKLLVLMDFPEQPLEPVSLKISVDEVAAALGVAPNVIVDMKQAMTDLLVRVTPEGFATLKPDFVLLAKTVVRGFAVTAEMPKDKASDVNIQSRFFAPRIGVNEDPVTGSVHCALGPYWSPVLQKTKIKAQQFTPVRGGYITLDLVAADPGRVLLKGEGTIVLRGKLASSP